MREDVEKSMVAVEIGKLEGLEIEGKELGQSLVGLQRHAQQIL